MSVPALYYVPNYGDDLYRYYLEMGVVQNYNNIHSLIKAYHIDPYLIQHDINHSSNYIYDIVQWIISRSGNDALLPFLSILIVYLCLFIPFIHQYIINKFNNKNLFLGLLIIMALFPYNASISTIRWSVASAIFFLITYIVFNCKCSKLWILPSYLIPIFIHQALLLPVIVIIICILCSNIHIKWYLYLLWPIFVLLVLKFISNGTNGFSKNIQTYNSSNASTFIGGSGFALLWTLFANIIPYIYLILGFFLINRNKKINLNIEVKALILSTVTDVPLLFYDITMFGRYALTVGLCGVLVYLKINKCKGLINFNVKFSYFVTSFICISFMVMYIIFKLTFNFSQINFTGVGF